MKLIKASILAKSLGISGRTVTDWCINIPDLAIKKGHDYWIRIDILATRPGMDIIQAFLCQTQRWVKAVDLAKVSDKPRRTIAEWCKSRPRFARRIGRIWYVNLDSFGATLEQQERLEQLIKQRRLGYSENEEGTTVEKAPQDS